MAIRFLCPECQEPQEVSDAVAGLDVRCPSCSVRIPVPRSSDPQVPSRHVESTAESPSRGGTPGRPRGRLLTTVLMWVALLFTVISLSLAILRELNEPELVFDAEQARQLEEMLDEQTPGRRTLREEAAKLNALFHGEGWKRIEARVAAGRVQTDAFLEDLRADHVAAARARTSEAFQSEQSDGEFAAYVRQFPALKQSAKCTSSLAELSSQRSTIRYQYDLASDSEPRKAVIVVLELSGGPVIDEFTVE